MDPPADMPALPQSASRITLRARPKGLIEPDLTGKGTFNLEKGVKLPSLADLKEGNILVRVEWLSLDPAMRGWLNDSRSYLPPVQIGEVMR
jgi:NADPH-dependent curcumin reductase CurA